MSPNRWRIQNLNYDYDRPVGATARLKRADNLACPWEVFHADLGDHGMFATHAEAITYADKQARRTA